MKTLVSALFGLLMSSSALAGVIELYPGQSQQLGNTTVVCAQGQQSSLVAKYCKCETVYPGANYAVYTALNVYMIQPNGRQVKQTVTTFLPAAPTECESAIKAKFASVCF